MKSLQTNAMSSINLKTGTRLLVVIIMLFSAGCTALPGQQIGSWENVQSRQQAQVDHEKRFIAYRKQCFVAGRRIWIDGKHKVGRNGIPHRLDRYTCV